MHSALVRYSLATYAAVYSGLVCCQPSAKIDSVLTRLKVKAYGVVNYYTFDWETLPDKNDAIDPERLNFYTYYHFSPLIEFKSEIEFEHGGTGSTMSFDPLEEFGEFESEIEKGGQVVLEQINLLFKWKNWLRLRMGKMRFYMGNASVQDEPREYFTTYRSETENTILPLGWYETGLEFSGTLPLRKERTFPQLSYKLYAVTGLDNSGFSSSGWIRNGYQTRFETVSANAFAYAARFDYEFAEESQAGFCIYTGNTSPNRPKDDFDTDAWLSLGDLHFTYSRHPWRVSAYGMYGSLQHSASLSYANQNLSNNLNVKRTPVGAAAVGAYCEAGYDLLHIFRQSGTNSLYAFVRTEYYDSMHQTEGNVTDNPRYSRTVYTAGFNYFPFATIVIKAHYALRTLDSGENERTFSAGFGFNF